MKIPGIFWLFLTAAASAGEILIHEGPTVSIPGLKILGPDGKGNAEPPELTYIKRFYGDEKLLVREDPAPSRVATASLPATEAITLALATIKPNHGDYVFVTKLELLGLEPSEPTRPGYYLITISVTGSEEHRLVMMDGTVLTPRLKRLE